MTGWQRWLQAPATLGWRRALLQIHLWLGIIFGIYVLVVSVSGSLLLLRPLMQQWFVPSSVEANGRTAMRSAEIDAALAAAYPGYEITDSMLSSEPDRALFVIMVRDGVERRRFFDQYEGRDLGDPDPWQVRAAERIAGLHTDLSFGRTGRDLNGIGAGMFVVMALSGLVLWWQGIRRWYEGLLLRRGHPRGVLWQLHSVLGFGAALLLLAWGISGLWFSFPTPFNVLIDWLDDDPTDFRRPIAFLDFLINVHRGRYDVPWLHLLWGVLALLPVVLLVTGIITWWRQRGRGGRAH